MVRASVHLFERMPPCVHVCAGSEWCVRACVCMFVHPCICVPAHA